MAKIRLHDGSLVDPFNLGKDDIKPQVFIHQLCLLNRFHGATKYPYSVGQHSVNLFYLVPAVLQPAALIHDMQEAMFNDLAAPVKYECPVYVEAEHEAGAYIAKWHGVSPRAMEEVKVFDKRIYVNERDALFDNVAETVMGDDRQALNIPVGLPNLFAERNWREVKKEYLDLYRSTFYG